MGSLPQETHPGRPFKVVISYSGLLCVQFAKCAFAVRPYAYLDLVNLLPRLTLRHPGLTFPSFNPVHLRS